MFTALFQSQAINTGRTLSYQTNILIEFFKCIYALYAFSVYVNGSLVRRSDCHDLVIVFVYSTREIKN